MLYYILFFALRVSSAAKQTCKIYHRQILYIIAVIVIFFFLRFIGFNIIHLLYQSTLCFLIPAIFFLQVAPNFSVKRS